MTIQQPRTAKERRAALNLIRVPRGGKFADRVRFPLRNLTAEEARAEGFSVPALPDNWAVLPYNGHITWCEWAIYTWSVEIPAYDRALESIQAHYIRSPHDFAVVTLDGIFCEFGAEVETTYSNNPARGEPVKMILCKGDWFNTWAYVHRTMKHAERRGDDFSEFVPEIDKPFGMNVFFRAALGNID